jgi:TrmH family RNA methyltransferase
MAERITSKTNSTLQHIRRLLTSRKYRYECRSFVADGVKLVDEALHWSIRVEALVLCDGVEFPVPEGVREIRVPPALMKDVSRMETPQGVIALCRMPEPEPFTPTPGCLILDGIQDPGNLGTILRTADAFEIPVVLADGCADPYGEKTVRASMGALFDVKVALYDSFEDYRKEFPNHALYPFILQAETPLKRANKQYPATLIMGNEATGLPRDFLNVGTPLLIPHTDFIDSLNLDNATAIALYEFADETF